MSKNMYALTNPQKSIWLTEQFYKGMSIENITGTVIVSQKVGEEGSVIEKNGTSSYILEAYNNTNN